MNQVFGLLIAVEKYQDPGIPAVRYAENDAKGLRDALELHGLEPDNAVLLLSAEATKSRIESALRRICKRVQKGDTLYFFYAGHGFSNNGTNYITCNDTVNADLARTSIELQYVLKLLKDSDCKKIVLFLDSCHSGLEIDEGMRSILSDLNDDDFVEFCKTAEHHHAFASCQPDEQSYSALFLKHGIWTHHLLEALHGRDKKSLERGKFLTATSLQAYLSTAVSKSPHLKPGKFQNPVAWGSQTREFMIADFTQIFAEQEAAAQVGLSEFKGISMHGSVTDSIKRLSGFKKHHRLPDAFNDTTRSFVRSAASEEIEERIEYYVDALRKAFRYKRTELNVNSPGLIVTPDFSVAVDVDIDEDDLSKYVISTSVYEISSPALIASEEFAEVFDHEFDKICFSVSRIDVAAVIDKIEGGNTNLEVRYPSSAHTCTITAPGLRSKIEVDSSEIILDLGSEQPIQALLSEGKSFVRLASSGDGSLGTALRLIK